MPSDLWPVCRRDDLAAPGCREFDLQVGEKTINGFVVHWRGQWYAYLNSCPHTRVGLNWLPDQFFDLEQRYLQCSLHGALFEPETGLCIYGPCRGRTLTRLPVVVRHDDIAIARRELDEL
ncbi:MAG: Rieske 2Fe-2S domain-containing protein [Gammaproteobacteria bacterium]|nr:Rieske 2Fe-2S domain-containing protein [Gammaproteobacteria bacterium]